MSELRSIRMIIEEAEISREIGLGLRCEHLHTHHGGHIVNRDGRKVCDECCDHSSNITGTFRWNGLTYCSNCCEHDFGHRNFVERLGDALNTCTLCWLVSNQHTSTNCRPHTGRVGVKPIRPKIVLINCEGDRIRLPPNRTKCDNKRNG